MKNPYLRKLISIVAILLLVLCAFGIRSWQHKREVDREVDKYLPTIEDVRQAGFAPKMAALMRIGKPAIPKLTKLLEIDPNSPDECLLAYYVMENLPAFRPEARQVAPRLAPLLQYGGWRQVIGGAPLSFLAARKLGKLGKDAVPWIRPYLHSRDWQTRNAALLCFTEKEMDTQSFIPELLPFLKDENPNVRVGAAYVISELGPHAKQAVPDLIRLLSDTARVASSPDCVNQRVAGSLSKIGAPAIPALKAAETGPNPDVREQAKIALDYIQKAHRVKQS